MQEFTQPLGDAVKKPAMNSVLPKSRSPGKPILMFAQ